MPEYLIDQLLPTSRVHLIGGNSNAGKTRFTVPMALEWSVGASIMGFESHPVPWAYVIGDRLKIEAEDTLTTMGIDPKRVPMIPAFGTDNKNWKAVMQEAAKMKIGFLVWEGFADFAYGDKRHQIREFLSDISACCYSSDFHNGSLTILGVMESPKAKPGEKYPDPRQRISGMASWGYHSSTVMLIEAEDARDISNPRRKLYASLKNGPSFDTVGDFDPNGRLIFAPPMPKI